MCFNSLNSLQKKSLHLGKHGLCTLYVCLDSCCFTFINKYCTIKLYGIKYIFIKSSEAEWEMLLFWTNLGHIAIARFSDGVLGGTVQKTFPISDLRGGEMALKNPYKWEGNFTWVDCS